ncbi:pali-domain-containing protein [Lindgomyces ingoldianus]|uniref:Pali-domain-containing protein n=1 Tax=Lindgomyces ingoldianus TaxID=673940 RepID=A0ACB6RDT8_9PLEO|nr:pali-domain-containing protein [Lindgomyces ingoldianus]KAF2477296.1 pali-domain-containing protein [Lindgomyces ingoldianus]
MLRPATPLSILFFAAFVLLLLSTLSTPIIRGIPLATFQGVNFGVFGYCDGSKCDGPRIGYDTDGLFANASDSEFSLPSATRHSLSSILIVHPVATLLTLVCFSLAVAAHFHSPAHSPRYLLALLILTFPTLLVSLLAFLVDILLFVPHVAWGGWVVLAATIIIVASGVVTCAMRRTLVSRKARKKRIAENPDMNGQNYFANRTATQDVLPKAESPPPLSGDTVTSGPDKLPGFATYDMQNQHLQDDMTPLNPRNPSLKTNSSGGRDGPDRSQNPSRGPSGRGRQPVDQYGNPIPLMPNDGFAMQNIPRMGPPRMGPPPNRGGPQVYGRGRGYPPRGGFGPPPRGGFGPPPRGGYGPPRGGMRGPPPPGWNGNGRGGMGPGPMPDPGIVGRGQRGPPPEYSNDFYGQAPPPGREPSPYGQRGVSPAVPMQPPMPIGQAIEMNGRSGTPSVTPNQNYGLRESDGDVQGMLALQQGGFEAQPPTRRPSNPMSPTSNYSGEEDAYVPPRANWNQNMTNPSDQTLPTNSSNSRGLSPIQDSPVELPAQLSTIGVPNNDPRSSNYYEDVDPQFAEPVNSKPAQARLPSALVPGGLASSNPNRLNISNPSLNTSDPALRRNSSYEDIPDGSRSPAASEASHFTSVSQRGINPNWRPPPPGMGGPPIPGQYGPYNARRPMRQEDVILEANAANPDFAVPGAELGRGRGRGRGAARGRGVPGPSMINGMGMGNQGRYPGANAI